MNIIRLLVSIYANDTSVYVHVSQNQDDDRNMAVDLFYDLSLIAQRENKFVTSNISKQSW